MRARAEHRFAEGGEADDQYLAYISPISRLYLTGAEHRLAEGGEADEREEQRLARAAEGEHGAAHLHRVAVWIT